MSCDVSRALPPLLLSVLLVGCEPTPQPNIGPNQPPATYPNLAPVGPSAAVTAPQPTASAATAKPAALPDANAFVTAAWPANIPKLEDSASCDTGSCNVSIALSTTAVAPANQPAPAHLWEHRLAAGTTLSIPRDDALTVLGVVLEGAVKDERSPGEPRTLLVDDDGKALPDQALGPRAGFFYRGGGFTLRAENNQPARVLLAVVQRRDATVFKASGAVWTQRPTGYLDAIDHFDFQGPTLVFGAGKLNAILGLQDHEEAAPIFAVEAPDPKGRKPTPPPVEEQGPVSWKPDASCTLLGIRAGGEVAEHVHENAWEFLAILSGEGDVRFSLPQNAAMGRTLRPGSILAIPRDIPHSFKARDGAPVVAIQLYTPPGPEQRFKILK